MAPASQVKLSCKKKKGKKPNANSNLKQRYFGAKDDNQKRRFLKGVYTTEKLGADLSRKE